MFKKALGPLLYGVCLACVLHAGTPQSVAQAVLDRLYTTNGNYQFKKPKILIAAKNNKGGAVYESWRNTIYLDQKAYDICRTFGPDSLSALAFVLGHELVHAYQNEIKKGQGRSNFLAYTRNYGSDVRIEKSADIQGLFNAQLSGYRAIRVMPEVIEKVYQTYQLGGRTLPGYPSLEERKASAREVLQIAETLIDIFESANYLSAIGEYQLAIAGYQHILQYYQGIEIYNNLGVANALVAQQFWNAPTDKFLYPLEVDWYSKLTRAISRGQEGPDPMQDPLRLVYLDNALNNFRTAARLNPGYLPIHTNIVCVLNLMGNHVEAQQYGELKLRKALHRKKGYKGPKQDLEMAEIALGITYALVSNSMQKNEATAIFKRLSGSKYVASALYARQNLQCLQGNADNNVLNDLALPESFREQIRAMQPGRTSDLKRQPLDAQNTVFFAKKRSGESATSVFSNAIGGNLISLLRFQNRSMKNLSILPADQNLDGASFRNILAARNGFYLHAKADQAVIKLDAKGHVLEMVKYVVH